MACLSECTSRHVAEKLANKPNTAGRTGPKIARQTIYQTDSKSYRGLYSIYTYDRGTDFHQIRQMEP